MGGRSNEVKPVYKTATGQVITGTCFIVGLRGIPGTAAGNVVLYSGTAATSGNEIYRTRVAQITGTANGNTSWIPKGPVKCDGGIYATLTGTAMAIIVELEA